MKLNFYPTMGLSPSTGYGRLSLGIAKGLQQAGIEICVYPDSAAPTLVIGLPNQFDAEHIRHTRRIAYTLIESNKPSAELVNALNQHCAMALVPCPPLANIYREHGVTIPIEIAAPGVDLFLPDMPLTIHNPDSPFTFLTYSYSDTRKGADIVVKAFQELYRDNPDFRLIIKARDGYGITTWLSQLHQPNIELVIGQQAESDWQKLLHKSHCFVFASRAEGWGMPPRETTLLGIPTIATQWLGLWDIDQWGIALPVKSLSPANFRFNPFNAEDAQWAEPDEDVLAEKMRWVVANYAAAKQLALHGRGYLLANFTWAKVGQQLKKLVFNL